MEKKKDLPFDYGFVCLGMRANAPVLDEIREAFADTNVESSISVTAYVLEESLMVFRKDTTS